MRLYLLVNLTASLALLCLLVALVVGIVGAWRHHLRLRRVCISLVMVGVLLLLASLVLTLMIP
ncbi:hypothetical protein [Deinococcus koreensis]|uniref:Uncharacterized protein n=1 Tax=Deinococcus koreensis TaxID=2054903 RepID=A0A2K3URY0_9DEIO|nr:hypothetical protein [Deinococcus koreensis]PNY79274.1 hypothetical protein CVO96_20395 [Deinococcus koreensis]